MLTMLSCGGSAFFFLLSVSRAMAFCATFPCVGIITSSVAECSFQLVNF